MHKFFFHVKSLYNHQNLILKDVIENQQKKRHFNH